MDTKKCKVCERVKPINQFYKQSTGKFGYTGKCKICYNTYKKELLLNSKKEIKDVNKNYYVSSNIVKFTNPTKKDYMEMYNFMESIGYDPKGNIAKQFAEKWNVPYVERNDEKNMNAFSYDDCIKETPND